MAVGNLIGWLMCGLILMYLAGLRAWRFLTTGD
jgi:hypothetical protein